jgi:hypothetical protein
MGITATLAAFANLGVAPPVARAVSRSHSVRVTVPSQFDFTLVSLRLGGSAAGSRVSTAGPVGFDYVAIAAQRAEPRRIFILVVNRLKSGSLAQGPASISLSVKTHEAESAPAIAQHVDILVNGAPGQDCSSLTNYPGLGHPYIWGYKLRPLAPSLPGPFGVSEAVAHALAQACSDPIDMQFERWVRQEPGSAHP